MSYCFTQYIGQGGNGITDEKVLQSNEIECVIVKMKEDKTKEGKIVGFRKFSVKLIAVEEALEVCELLRYFITFPSSFQT